MYYIIESKSQIQYLIDNSRDQCFINLITLNDNYHPKLTSPCLLYFKPKDDKSYILCINHSDSFSLEFEDVLKLLNKYTSIYCLDKKFHLYFLDMPLIDINFLKLSEDNNIFDLSMADTPVHLLFNKKFKDYPDVNKLIPIPKHFEKQEHIYDIVKDKLWQPFTETYYDEYINAFYNIEKNGIKIDNNTFFKNFEPYYDAASIKDDIIYTNYNLYNITTRPTNVFNNINFSALTKSSRISFIPRNDMLIEYDFDAYHPRLIGALVGYKFTAESAHKQLSQLYFEEADELRITEELVNIAKNITFKMLYGSIDEKYANVEYFKKVTDWINKEWEGFESNGYFTLKCGRKIYKQFVPNFRKNKLLSWYTQSNETYRNTKILTQLHKLLKDKKSKIIYNMYDSFLIDYSKDDGKELLENITKILETDSYPTKIHHGSNYGNLIRLL